MTGGINGLGKAPIASTVTKAPRNANAQSASAVGTNGNTQSLKQDSVALTDTLTGLQRLSEIMASDVPVDKAKVASLRDSISEGGYVVDAQATARNFARLELELGGL